MTLVFQTLFRVQRDFDKRASVAALDFCSSVIATLNTAMAQRQEPKKKLKVAVVGGGLVSKRLEKRERQQLVIAYCFASLTLI